MKRFNRFDRIQYDQKNFSIGYTIKEKNSSILLKFENGVISSIISCDVEDENILISGQMFSNMICQGTSSYLHFISSNANYPKDKQQFKKELDEHFKSSTNCLLYGVYNLMEHLNEMKFALDLFLSTIGMLLTTKEIAIKKQTRFEKILS